LDTYLQQMVLLTGVYVILSVGLHIITGEAGLLSIGTAGFMAIGAYTTTILCLQYHLPFYASLLIAMAVSAVFGILIGFPTLRLKGDYLLMATFGLTEITRVTLLNLKITNGALGISGIPALTNLGNVLGAIVLVVAATVSLRNSHIGRAWHAIRENEIAAEAMGINPTFYKTLAFALGSAFSGLAGGLYAFLIGFISPNDFNAMFSFTVYLFIVLGGLGSLAGAILGTVILTFLPEYLRFLADYRMIIYGLFLVVMVVFRPQGLLGNVSILSFLSRKFSAPDRGDEMPVSVKQ
jgi:branched-chain amino acid transport system permease protein